MTEENKDLLGEEAEEKPETYEMLTDELKEEIQECFDIFDKDKDG